jgi:branched-chain amino acid transport system substrate-binding protein
MFGSDRRSVLAVTIVCLLAAGACGSRLDHEQLVAQWRARFPATQFGPGTVGSAPVESTEATTPGPAPTTEPPANGARHEAAANTTAPAPSRSTGRAAEAVAEPDRPKGSATGAAAVRTPGASQSGAPAAPAPNTPPAAAGCSGSKAGVILGSVGTQTGVLGAQLNPQVKAVQAWVADVNRRGGVNCHPVARLIVADDGGDPSRNQSLTQQLVEQEKVIAFVNNTGVLTGQASVDYLTRKRVPVIGSDLGGEYVYTSPMYFPQAASGILIVVATFGGIAEVGRAEGKSKLGAVGCVEADVCSKVYDLAPSYAAKFGLDLVYRGRASLAQPDYTSNCQAAQSAGAQFLFIALDYNSFSRFARSCATVNYRPVYATSAAAADPRMAGSAELDGLTAGVTVVPWTRTDNPEVAAFRRALQAQAAGLEPSAVTIIGWVSAKLFEAATRDLPDPPTSQGVLEGLWKIRENDLNGLTAPLTFNRDQKPSKAPFCFWYVRTSGGKFVTGGDGHRICRDDLV